MAKFIQHLIYFIFFLLCNFSCIFIAHFSFAYAHRLQRTSIALIVSLVVILISVSTRSASLQHVVGGERGDRLSKYLVLSLILRIRNVGS